MYYAKVVFLRKNCVESKIDQRSNDFENPITLAFTQQDWTSSLFLIIVVINIMCLV